MFLWVTHLGGNMGRSRISLFSSYVLGPGAPLQLMVAVSSVMLDVPNVGFSCGS